MTIKSFIPSHELEWKPDQPDGSGRAQIECDEGVVTLFTYPGHDRQRAFTNLQMWISPRRYHATIARHYHPRWWRRIAREFAWKVGKQTEGSK